MAHLTDEQRFMRFVRTHKSGCWRWGGYIDKGGYAHFNVPRQTPRGRKYVRVRAFRWAYEHWIGPIPDGLTLDHVKDWGCIFTDCVNPQHGEAVSNGVNVLRSNGPTAKKARQVTCIHDHAYQLDSVDSNGKRYSKQCKAEYAVLYRAQKKAAV